jgi:choline dehydrogenase-like flavoprotein
MKKTGELLFAAGAQEVSFTNQVFPTLTRADELTKVDEFPIEPGLAIFTSAHNQGTCRMGSSKDNSVVDQNLRLHTGDNIYVMDASVMPSSASTHVMMPIMVVVDRAVHRMLKA